MRTALKLAPIILAGKVGAFSSASEATPPPTLPDQTCRVTHVDAGYARIGAGGATIALNATIESSAVENGVVTSTDADCATIAWRQVSGDATVTIDDAASEDPTLTLPEVTESQTIVMEIAGIDDSGRSMKDQVVVEVYYPADSSDDKTALADFTTVTDPFTGETSANAFWQCDQDPIADPSVTKADLGASISYQSNGVPAHATGTFPNPGNPNTASVQSEQFYIPKQPQKTETATDMRQFGMTTDGVLIERETAEWYGRIPNGEWLYEAVTPGAAAAVGPTPPGRPPRTVNWLGTDCANAHVQPDGEYHYHAMMEPMLLERAKDRHGHNAEHPPHGMTLGGYAADGFPFYLRYGHADPRNRSSELKVMEASWALKEGYRDVDPADPIYGDLATTTYDGAFREDWEYVAGSGDLDECNGVFGPTPEYPHGIYHYFITDDYPYIPRCVFGTPDESFWTCDPDDPSLPTC